MQTDDRQPEIRTGTLAGLALLSAAAYLTIYTSLHQAGHALTGLWFGQKLSGFNFQFWDLSTHVSLSGSLSPAQNAIQSAAGVVSLQVNKIIGFCAVLSYDIPHETQ